MNFCLKFSGVQKKKTQRPKTVLIKERRETEIFFYLSNWMGCASNWFGMNWTFTEVQKS